MKINEIGPICDLIKEQRDLAELNRLYSELILSLSVMRLRAQKPHTAHPPAKKQVRGFSHQKATTRKR